MQTTSFDNCFLKLSEKKSPVFGLESCHFDLTSKFLFKKSGLYHHKLLFEISLDLILVTKTAGLSFVLQNYNNSGATFCLIVVTLFWINVLKSWLTTFIQASGICEPVHQRYYLIQNSFLKPYTLKNKLRQNLIPR